MRILQFVHTYGEQNGISLHVYNLVNGMPDSVETRVIWGRGASLPFFSALKLPISEFFEALGANFDAIHVHGYGNFFSFAGATVSLLKGKPLVWTIHGYPRMHGARKLLYYFYRYFMAPFIFWRAKRIISVSGDILPILRRETRKEIAVMPNGVDLRLFRKRSPYTNADAVCFVGRLDEDKGIFRMLECRGRPLIFMGPDEDGNKAKIEAEAKAQNVNASFAQGGYKGMPSAYERCRYVALPSKYEGFPLTLLESIAMGRPFISTDVGEVKKVMETLGMDSEKFILRGNLGEKVSELDRLSLEKEMEKARERLEGYSWQGVAEKTARIYSDVCKKN